MGPGFAKGEICEKNRPGQKFMEREKRKLASESEKSGSLGREKGLSALGSLPSPIFAGMGRYQASNETLHLSSVVR